MTEAKLCECGCGTPCARRFVRNHHQHIKPDDPQEIELRLFVLACWAQRLSVKETAAALGISERTVCARRAVLGLARKPWGTGGVPEAEFRSLVLACWAQRLNTRETADALGVSQSTVSAHWMAIGLQRKPCGICGTLTNDPGNLCFSCRPRKARVVRRKAGQLEGYIPTGSAKDVLEVLSTIPDGCASTWYIERLLCSPTGVSQLPRLQTKRLVERVARGEWRITEDGRHVLRLARAKDHETKAGVVVTA